MMLIALGDYGANLRHKLPKYTLHDPPGTYYTNGTNLKSTLIALSYLAFRLSTITVSSIFYGYTSRKWNPQSLVRFVRSDISLRCRRSGKLNTHLHTDF